MSGKVYLIGAGPGDRELITKKGEAVLKSADVVLYDRLANDRLLDYAQSAAELIYVGKKAGDHSYTQAELNQLMLNRARAGDTVARLKGGDPFIFGRGGEEAVELTKGEVEFEIVPGITSAIAAPAYAGIPLTHRDFSSSTAFVTGHSAATKEESSVNWEQLAQGVETLVVLMGVGNLPQIVDKLMASGRSADTPVALVRWGSWAKQKTITGELKNIVSKVRAADFEPPAVIIIGDVVNLRSQLNWFESKPLFGKRIAVTRPSHQAESFCRLLNKKGAKPLRAPAIEIKPPVDFTPLDNKLKQLSGYDWVIFTSVNGVDYTLNRLFELDQDVRAFGGVKLAAIGTKTGSRLEEYGLTPDYIPEEYVSEALITGFSGQDLAGQHFLLPRANIARPKLKVGLENLGAEVDNVTAYRTVEGKGADNLLAHLSQGEVEIITFTSSSTVRNLLDGLGNNYQQLLTGVKIACIGPITAKTARETGLEVDIVADEYTIEGLTEAIEEHYN